MSNMFVVVDIESTGPIVGVHSMYEFGAAAIINGKIHTFSQEVKLISNKYEQGALDACNVTMEQLHNRSNASEPHTAMKQFNEWINKLLINNKLNKAVFFSDNVAFDWQWINYYFLVFNKTNPFGFSGRRIGDLYSGIVNDIAAASKWKYLRKAKHTHKAVDDAKGNAEALIAILDMMNDKREVKPMENSRPTIWMTSAGNERAR